METTFSKKTHAPISKENLLNWKLLLPEIKKNNTKNNQVKNIYLYNFFARNGTGKTKLSNIILEKSLNKQNAIKDMQLHVGQQYLPLYFGVDIRIYLDETYFLYPKDIVSKINKISTPLYSTYTSNSIFESDFFYSNKDIKFYSTFYSFPLLRGVLNDNDENPLLNYYYFYLELFSSILKIDILKFSYALLMLKRHKRIRNKIFDKLVNTLYSKKEIKKIHIHIKNKKFSTLTQSKKFSILSIFQDLIKNMNTSHILDLKKIRKNNLTLKKEISTFNKNFNKNFTYNQEVIDLFNQISPLEFTFIKKYNSLYNMLFYDLNIKIKSTNQEYSSQSFLKIASTGQKIIFYILKLSIHLNQEFIFKNPRIDESPQISSDILIVADDIFTSLDQENMFLFFYTLMSSLNNLRIKKNKNIHLINFTHDKNIFNFVHNLKNLDYNFFSQSYYLDKIDFLSSKNQVLIEYYNYISENSFDISKTSNFESKFEILFIYLTLSIKIRESLRTLKLLYHETDSIFHLHDDPINTINSFLTSLASTYKLNNHVIINDTTNSDIFQKNQLLTIIFSKIFIEVSSFYSKNDIHLLKFRALLYRKILDTLWLSKNIHKAHLLPSLLNSLNNKKNNYQYFEVNDLDTEENKNHILFLRTLLINKQIHNPDNIFNYQQQQYFGQLEDFFNVHIRRYSLMYDDKSLSLFQLKK